MDSEKGKPPKRTGRKATDLKLGMGLRGVGCRARIAGLPKRGYLFVWFGFFVLAWYEAMLSVKRIRSVEVSGTKMQICSGRHMTGQSDLAKGGDLKWRKNGLCC